MFKVIQGGIRISAAITLTSGAAPANAYPGKGVIPSASAFDGTTVAIPVAADITGKTALTGLRPLGLIFDGPSEMGNTATARGVVGGGGSSTTVYSTGNTQAQCTIVTGTFLAEVSNDDFNVVNDFTAAAVGTGVMILGAADGTAKTSGGCITPLAATSGQVYCVGTVVSVASANKIRVLFNFGSPFGITT